MRLFLGRKEKLKAWATVFGEREGERRGLQCLGKEKVMEWVAVFGEREGEGMGSSVWGKKGR